MPTGVDDPHLTENPNGISVPQDGFSEEDKKKIRKIIEKHAKDKSGGNYTPDLEKRLKEAKEGKEEKKEEENKENKPTKPLASPKKSEKNESAGENKDKQSKSMCDRSGNFIDFDFKKPETEADKTYQDELFHEYWPHIHAIKEKIEEMQPNQWKVNIDNRGPMMHPLGLYLAGVDPNAKNLPRINLEKRELDYEINLLLDCSDSTSGEKGVLYYEKICAGMIAKAFDEDFPTTGERFGHSDKGLEVKLYGFNSSWSSGIQIYTAENLEELAKFTSDGGTPEAEALRILSQEKILPSTKRDKMLFVFADGQPNDVYAAKEELQTIKNKGVNVFYILVSESGEQGVDWSNYDILKQGATESRVLYDPSELPGIVRDIVTEYVGV